jgi:hypothetical protein
VDPCYNVHFVNPTGIRDSKCVISIGAKQSSDETIWRATSSGARLTVSR